MEIIPIVNENQEGSSPTYIKGPRQGNPENVQEESHRENKIPEAQESFVLGSQEELDRNQNDLGSDRTEQLHSDNNIQNDYSQRGENASPIGSMDGVLGSEGRLPPPSDIQEIPTVSRLLLQRPELEVQSHALWPEYSSQDLYEVDCLRSSLPIKRRGMGPTLPRRSLDNCQFQGGMPEETTNNSGHTHKTGLDYQHREIQNGATTDIRLVRSPLQPSGSHCSEHSRESQSVSDSAERLLEGQVDNKTSNHAASRFSELVRSGKPASTCIPVQNQTPLETPQESTFRHQDSNEQPLEVSTSERAPTENYATASRSPNDHMHNPLGRVSNRLGIQNQPGKIQGTVRQFNESSFHKCSRTLDNMVGHSDDRSEESDHTHMYGQFNRSISGHEQVVKLRHSSRDSRVDLEESRPHELDYNYSPYSREVQHTSRPALQKHHHIDRVDHTTSNLPQGDHEDRATSPSRLVCHEPQQSVANICLTMPGRQSNSSRCPADRLGQMGPHIPVPSDPNDFEGFAETHALEYTDRDHADSRRTKQAMVPTAEIKAFSIKHFTYKATTTGRRRATVRDENFKNSRLEVLKVANSTRYPDCDNETINLISSPVKKSSENDYQRKWKYFLDFVAEKEIAFENITIDIVLRFFSFLFYKKGLKPSTVTHYRSALSQPLREYFNIELTIPAVTSMLRAMKLQRPNEPSSRPAWSLSKVLSYLETLDTSSIVQSLRKTAFLLLLATGWRASELHACVRNVEFCRFTENSTLIIQPHSSFLAKNGLRKRITAKDINLLKTPEGNISKLCPVTALRQYLKNTSNYKEGCLFLDPKDGSNLSLFKLRYNICCIITQADPDTRARVHDIRKFSASCCLQQDMIVGDLTEDFNWSGPSVFYKYYFLQTDTLETPVSLPVRS